MFTVSVSFRGEHYPVKYGSAHRELVDAEWLARSLSAGIGRDEIRVETVAGPLVAEALVVSCTTQGLVSTWVDTISTRHEGKRSVDGCPNGTPGFPFSPLSIAKDCSVCYGTGTTWAGDEEATCMACEGGKRDWREFEAGIYARLLHQRELGGHMADARVVRFLATMPDKHRAYIQRRGEERLPEIRELHVKLGNEAGKLPGR